MDERNKAGSRDVALLYAPTDDGKGARVLRSREGSLETGEVRPVRDGQPVQQGELVRLLPREEASCLYDVEVLHDGKAEAEEPSAGDAGPATKSSAASAESARGRPPQVASDDYRENWDRIFAGRSKRDRSLN
jgi:hypothetical protein